MTDIGRKSGLHLGTRTDQVATSGGTGPFTLGWLLSDQHLISVGGVPQPPGAYTVALDIVNGQSDITLTSAPGASDFLDVWDWGQTGITHTANNATPNLVTGQGEVTSVDGAADHLLIHDASAGALKKVLPSNLGLSSPTGNYKYTDTTDIALQAYTSATNVIGGAGSAQTITMPSAGLIHITWTGRLETGASPAWPKHLLVFGLRISSTNYFGSLDHNGTSYAAGTGPGNHGWLDGSQYFVTDAIGHYVNASTSRDPYSAYLTLDIEAIGIPTGSQSVEVVVGAGAVGSTLKGTTTPTRVYLTIQDFS